MINHNLKKCTFYTLSRLFGEITALQVVGYSVNGFYIYTNRNKHNCLVTGVKKWFCIVPEYGISAGSFNTLQDAIEFTLKDETIAKLENVRRTHGAWYERKFKEYLKKAGVDV